MDNIQINEAGELVITPYASSAATDFDFLQGSWNVRNRKLKTRLNGCTDWIEFAATQELSIILQGKGNFDLFKTDHGGQAFEGMTLRLFNPVTRLWSIYWADSQAVTLDLPVVGSFEGGIGHFYTRDQFEGRPIIMRFNWDASNPDAPIWSQAFSDDNGQSWEWNWYMYFTRPAH